MSPAPIVISRSPSRRLGAERLGGLLGGRQPPDAPPAGTVGGLLGDHQAADPGERADRLLARRVDVEDRDLVGRRQGGAELRGERLGARVEMGLEGGDHAGGPSSRAASIVAETSVGWWA